MRETARSAHVWDKGWETALAAMQGGIGENGRKQNGTGYAARSLPVRVPAANLSWGKGGGCVTYSAAIGRNLVFHWLQPEAVRYFSNEAAGTRITSAYSPR